jgi:hypothetical protein
MEMLYGWWKAVPEFMFWHLFFLRKTSFDTVIKSKSVVKYKNKYDG